MTHFQDEGHYQEHINAIAQSEIEAQMQQEIGEAQAEMDALKSLKERELTIGEKLVGIDFNPSTNTEVQRVKELFAEITNTMLNNLDNKEISKLHSLMIDHSMCEILNAQMNVVKVLTFKY